MGVIGAKVGPFEIVEPVWVPDPGRWYRARAADGRDALVRVAGSERYDREAVSRQQAVLERLSDPRIPSILATDGKLGAIAVSPAIGTPLSDAIAQRADESVVLTPATLLDLVLDLARAIASAHAAGVVHGQLDPEQVVLTPRGQLYVWGFGTTRPPGKGWVPPEIARGGTPTEATDRWSVAAVACGLILGRPMWDEPGEAEVGDTSSAVQLIGRQWASLGRVMGEALAAKPKERPPTAELVAMFEDLAALAGPSTERPALGELLWTRRAAFMSLVDGGAPTAVPPSDVGEDKTDPGSRGSVPEVTSVVPSDHPKTDDGTLVAARMAQPSPPRAAPIVRVAPILAVVMVVLVLVWIVAQLV